MRSTLRISTKSWHGRIYAFWRRHAEFKTDGYRENLCHYARVVLFWGPLSIFLRAHPKGASFVRPCTVLAVMTVPTAIVWSAWMWPGETLRTFLLAISMLLALAGGVWIAARLDHSSEITDWFGRHTSWKRPFLFAGRNLEKVYDILAKPITVGRHRIPRVVPLIVAGWLIWIALDVRLLLVTAIVAAVAIAFLGGFKTYDLIEARRAKRGPDTGPGAARVGWELVVAKKHRVCPLIDVKD